MIVGIVDEVTAQTQGMALDEGQSESKTIREVINLDKRLVYQLVSLVCRPGPTS